MRQFICVFGALSLTTLLVAGSLAAGQPTPPNVIVMMADDMGMGDTSAYQDITGNADEMQIHTPSMDRLARMGVRFTDAHTPTSRCTGTRYGLLTGRYPWRSRLKHFVLFGVQGDPLIERDRPTLATLFKSHGYRTGMVGKWHVGLRYRQSDGRPADAWADADLSQPLYDTPLDHGFDECKFTSRSHGTSGMAADGKQVKKPASQSVGPGHIHGRTAVSATGNGKALKPADDPNAYVLNKLGSRHSNHAIGFMKRCVSDSSPFFMYYASNSNHSPYTPDTDIGGRPVKGASASVAGEPLPVWTNPKAKNKKKKPSKDLRHDFIYENDVALGRMLDYLNETDDPRRPGHRLIENTIVIFTSDNGAERNADYATGPFRSFKGSAYEGGHRVPLMVSWPAGKVGNGDSASPGQTNTTPTGLQDLFATFSEVLGTPLPSLTQGEKGGEDSTSVLAAWRGQTISRGPLFHNDHSEAEDRASVAFRIDDPKVGGDVIKGKWKLFFDGNLIRFGDANPTHLYDLASDPQEEHNRLADEKLASFVKQLTQLALKHRRSGGHRVVDDVPKQRVRISFLPNDLHKDVRSLVDAVSSAQTSATQFEVNEQLKITLAAAIAGKEIVGQEYHLNEKGLGISGNKFGQVDSGEAIVVQFDHDVFVESVSVVAGNGHAGGSYQVADHSPMAIYCVDDDIDVKDQQGDITDIGFLKAGQTLRLDSSPHLGVETSGRWRLAAITVRF